ncbi:hypothetical protein [Paractinoplanes ferrugineus]|nr:hypothetical protein [Actinoplanes ferrugineus]
MTGIELRDPLRQATARERTTTMHLATPRHRPDRHTRRLPSTAGGIDSTHEFWPIRPLANWTSGDHHRHGKTRAQPYPAGPVELGTRAR